MTPDPELTAIRNAVKAIESVEAPEERRRIIGYLAARFGIVEDPLVLHQLSQMEARMVLHKSRFRELVNRIVRAMDSDPEI